ncbi:MAG: hypothetical protein H6713_18250 [Myxococcales bacterium]|nr:hypothetical protein [Myxococcales bacterium]MCB9751920.1 hypothetical protein [Myxococcales bacterium]
MEGSLALGGGALALALLLLALLGTDAPVGVVSQLLGWGVVSIGLVVVAWIRRRYEAATPLERALMLITGDLLLTLLAAGVVLLAHARVHDRALRVACGQAAWSDDARAREDGYAESRRLQTSTWHAIASRIFAGAELNCEIAERVRARELAGLCPQNFPITAPCTCGAQRWPDDLECDETPSCRGRDDAAELVCPRDERPPPTTLEEARAQLREVQELIDKTRVAPR